MMFLLIHNISSRVVVDIAQHLHKKKKKHTSHRMKNTTWLIAVPENVVAHNPRHLQKLGDTLPAAGDEGPEGHHGCGAVKEKYVV